MIVDVRGPLPGGGFAASYDGRRLAVRHALPGERVRVDERGDAIEILTASPDRVAPPCPYAGPGRCGGCDYQHVSLAAQRALKSRVVSDLLGREVTVQAVTATDGLGWRTRVQFAVAEDGRLGLRRHRSHDVEVVDRCLIASPGVEAVGAERLSWPVAEQVEVIAGGTGDRAVVVTPRLRGARVGADVGDDVSVLRGDGRGGAEPVRGRPGVREQADDRTYWVSGSGFWQSHVDAPEVLGRSVLRLLEPEPGDTALDLYAGAGLFAGYLGPRTARVVAVESWPPAVADARQNLRDLRHVEVHQGKVDAVLARLGLGHVDLAVLDPPRDGANPAVLALLSGLTPRRIVYVSCDPRSLARDLATVPGYAATQVEAYDLFPMTSHVECVALLEPA